MKRFIKLNLVMFIILGAAFIAAIALLTLVIMANMDIEKHFEAAAKLRTEISKLNRQKPAPVKGNIALIQDDTKKIKAESAKLKNYFGTYEQPALEAFAKELGKPLAEFRDEFEKAWKEDANRNSIGGVERFYMRFSNNYPNWRKALAKFRDEYKKFSFETIDGSNEGLIFLSVMGVPRRLDSDSDSLLGYMFKMRSKAMDTLTRNNDDFRFLGDAADFSFDFKSEPNLANASATVENWEIIGDLVTRIAQEKLDAISTFDIRDLKGVESGDYKVHHFTFTVNGSITKIRSLIKALNDAYIDRRIYIVRSVFLYADVDGVNGLLLERRAEEERLRQNFGDESSSKDKDNSEAESGEIDPEDEEKRKVLDALPFDKRPGYGQVLFGGDLVYDAVFDVEYITLVKPKLD